jgi:hypothetical protein
MKKKNFIYVFRVEDRDKLLALGYQLLKSDDSQGMYIFENLGLVKFSINDMKFVLTDTLTF